MVDPSPLNLTINHWNETLRRALQIHLPSCNTCSYACKGYGYVLCYHPGKEMALPDTLSHSNPNLALRLHRILPSTMLVHPLSKRKPSNFLFEMVDEMCALTDIIVSGWPDDIKKSHTNYAPTGNTVNHSLLKMDLCSVEKPSSSCHQKKGEGPWYSAPIIPRHYQNSVACLWLCPLAWYQQGP